MAQRQVHGPNCSFDHGHSTVAQHGGRCPCCAVPLFSSAGRGGDSSAPTVAARLSAWTLSVHIPVVVQRQMSGGSDVKVAVTSRG